ncbi:MAG: DNA repair protein RecN [Verrucomicrobiota bacterium]
MSPQLTSLRIRNLALVEDLTWNLGPGFTVVTGETGSGKSMILGALKLLIGERADKSLIRTGADACTVEASFELPDPSSFNTLLQDHGVEACEDGQLLLKRVLTTAGSNRQFINGSPTTLAVLKTLGESLVDLHGPHDHQSLLSPELQRSLLDAFADASKPVAEYTAVYAQLHKLQSELDALCGDDTAFDRECALLSHQTAEIEAAALNPDEEEPLHSRYHLASQGRKIIELVALIQQRLEEGEDAALGRVTDLGRALRDLERIDPAAKSFSEIHARAVSELEELSQSLQRYSDHIDLDPERLQEMEDRVNLLETLKRKYGPSLQEVIAFGEEAAERHRKLSSRGEERSRLQSEIVQVQAAIQKSGERLSVIRAKNAPVLAAKVTDHMRELGLAKATFNVQLTQTPKPGPSGLETTEFLFAPNPGEPPKPLRAIASSGETSRIMLAVKSALAEQDTVALLVFDEIDANVGGEIAHSVGEKMSALGKQHQVLCISHLPQVASKADHHFVVSKTYVNERTISELTQVLDADREAEIARMLGGKTASAVALAKTLLER